MKKQYLIACILACSWYGAFASTTYDDNSESEPTVMVQRIEDEMGTDEALEILTKSLNSGPTDLTPIALQVVNRRFGPSPTPTLLPPRTEPIPFHPLHLYTFPADLKITAHAILPIGDSKAREGTIKSALSGQTYYGYALEVTVTSIFTSLAKDMSSSIMTSKIMESIPHVCYALIQHASVHTTAIQK